MLLLMINHNLMLDEDFMLYFLLILSFFNSGCLFGIAVFLVRFRDRNNKIFADLIEAMESSFSFVSPIATSSTEARQKTWDEKYEEELNVVARRVKENSNLIDLPDPTLSWGAPPAPKKINGLSMQD